MNSDRDIKTWDARLKEQSVRHWDNYKHLRIDLSTARNDEPLLISGEYLYCEDASDEDVAVAKIKFNRNTNDALDLELGVEVKTVFIEVFVTNEALEDEWLDLIFGINFEYKKKIADGFTNPITTAAGVDLVILPGAGRITQIGDAGATSHGLAANDDLFVSGKLEVDGFAHFDNQAFFYSNLTSNSEFIKYLHYGASMTLYRIVEEITIGVGQGAAGVVSASNLAPENSIIMAVFCRVTQAPGGGATTIDIGRTGAGNLDEFIDGIATALATLGNSAANHDPATPYPVLNGAADTFTVTTDANVLVTDMKVRVLTAYWDLSDLTM